MGAPRVLEATEKQPQQQKPQQQQQQQPAAPRQQAQGPQSTTQRAQSPPPPKPPYTLYGGVPPGPIEDDRRSDVTDGSDGVAAAAAAARRRKRRRKYERAKREARKRRRFWRKYLKQKALALAAQQQKEASLKPRSPDPNTQQAAGNTNLVATTPNQEPITNSRPLIAPQAYQDPERQSRHRRDPEEPPRFHKSKFKEIAPQQPIVGPSQTVLAHRRKAPPPAPLPLPHPQPIIPQLQSQTAGPSLLLTLPPEHLPPTPSKVAAQETASQGSNNPNHTPGIPATVINALGKAVHAIPEASNNQNQMPPQQSQVVQQSTTGPMPPSQQLETGQQADVEAQQLNLSARVFEKHSVRFSLRHIELAILRVQNAGCLSAFSLWLMFLFFSIIVDPMQESSLFKASTKEVEIRQAYDMGTISNLTNINIGWILILASILAMGMALRICYHSRNPSTVLSASSITLIMFFSIIIMGAVMRIMAPTKEKGFKINLMFIYLISCGFFLWFSYLSYLLYFAVKRMEDLGVYPHDQVQLVATANKNT